VEFFLCGGWGGYLLKENFKFIKFGGGGEGRGVGL